MNVEGLSQEAATLDAASFAGRFPDPALVLQRTVSLEETRIDTPTGGLRILGSTLAVGRRGDAGVRPDAAFGEPGRDQDLGQAFVLFLKKSDRNPFQNMITLGRAANNDVSIAHTTVSKLHAYFTPGARRWRITDQGSSNGTFVDGEQLARGGSAEIDCGARIALGPEVAARFFTPEGLYGFLELYRAGVPE